MATPNTVSSQPKKPRNRRQRLDAGNIWLYLGYAALLHLLFFGLSAFSDNLNRVVETREIPIEIMGVPEPDPEKLPVQPAKAEPPEAPPEAQPNPFAQAAKVAPGPRPEPDPSNAEEPPVDIANAMEAIETNSTETIRRNNIVPKREKEPDVKEPEDVKPVQRKQVSIAAAATQAAGRRGSGNFGRRGRGSGGVGETFGVTDDDLPVISGGAVFGASQKGALRGVLCFIPVGTKRLSQLGRCKPEGVMYTNQLNITPRRFVTGFPGVSDRSEWFAIDYNGRFTTSKAGEYKFRLHSDDGSILWVNGERVIDHGTRHSPSSKVGSIELDEGKHRIRVFYFQGPRVMLALQLFVTPPGEQERLWTPKL